MCLLFREHSSVNGIRERPEIHFISNTVWLIHERPEIHFRSKSVWMIRERLKIHLKLNKKRCRQIIAATYLLS